MTEFDPAEHRMVSKQRWFEDFVLGERQIDGGKKKRRDFEGGKRDPEQLQPWPFEMHERGTVPPDHRQ